jgi:uncharacterized protein YdaU (DUF1376 family)
MIQFPWYKWHSARWLSSRSRLTMNTSERSIYRDLLDHLYVDGNIPNDPKVLAMMAAVSEEEFSRAWPVVSRRFVPHPNEPNALTNANAEDEMRDRDEKSAAGARGGRPPSAERCPCGAMTRARADKRGHHCQECQKAGALQRESKTQTETEREERDGKKEQNTCASGDARVCDSPHQPKRKNPSSEVNKATAEQAAWFEQFWEAFWLKKSRKRAFEVFVSKVQSPEMFERVMEAVKSQSPEMLAREPQRRPYPETFIAEERWSDEVAEPARPMMPKIDGWD